MRTEPTPVIASDYHTPVLLHESIDGLNIHEDGIYVDVTFGGGGHSREIMRRIGTTGHLYSFDQDADAAQRAPHLEADGSVADPEGILPTPQAAKSFTFIRSNFRYLKNWMRYYGVDHINGLLADLGVSSHHFDDESRGFSFRFDAPLDMRMNTSARATAADVVNGYSEEQLADVFYHYGELRQSRHIASALVKARAVKPIVTTQDFLQTVEPLFRHDREKKDMARLFQALRIEVNHEMAALGDMLSAATELLGRGGRLVVITYHSLEDRLVKNLMRSGHVDGHSEQDFYGQTTRPFRLVNTKVITPSADEQRDNPRSRSAKLRIAEKI